MLNKVFLMGRLTRDPEMRTTQSGIPMCRITVAVDRNFVKQGEERQADFIDVTCWRQTAEFVCKWFTKGRMILVEGNLQNNNYTDKNGNKVYTYAVTADNVSFCGDKGNGGQNGGGYQNNNYGGQPGYGDGGFNGGGYQNGGYNGGNSGNGGYQNNGGGYGNQGGNYGGNSGGGNFGNQGGNYGGNAGGYGGNQGGAPNQGSLDSGDLSDFQVISDGEVPF